MKKDAAETCISGSGLTSVRAGKVGNSSNDNLHPKEGKKKKARLLKTHSEHGLPLRLPWPLL